MKPLERQTNLSLEELIKFLSGEQSHYPECLLINELGALCQQGVDKDLLGEKCLLTLITNQKEGLRFISFCCLSCIDGAEERNPVAFKEFREKPENDRLLPFIAKSLE